MRSWDVVGYIACALVLLTFYMKDMVSLRVAALCSNIAFLTYGISLGLMPVIVLHAILIPMNAWRLLSRHESSQNTTLQHVKLGQKRPY
jgi:hypothetical protein